MSSLSFGDVISSKALAGSSAGSRLGNYLALMKLRLVSLVLVTTAVGFTLGSDIATRSHFFLELGHVILGTGLVAAGAMALNQYLERVSDGLMRRTAHRPLPSRRLAPGDALLAGIGTAAAGLLYLASVVNLLAAALAGLTLISYLFLYTPLKTRTPLCTLVGGIPGAIPPMIGYAAAVGHIDGVAAMLFAILFTWQMPHFYAIAWLYREDYARGGQRMLPVVDPSGRRTARQVVVFSLLLAGVTLLPGLGGVAGTLYLAGAIALGSVFVAFSVMLAWSRTALAARQLFFVSVLYLPLLLGMLVYCR